MSSVRDRALSILELLVQHIRGLPMSEIADRLDIPRTAAHRLLGDLKNTGYVKQDPISLHYLLTVKLASLGLSYLAATGLADTAQPLLNELAESTGELARLAVVEQDRLIWVAKAQGARSGLRYDPDAGAEIYLPAAANGLAWLAALDDERVLQLISEQGLEKSREMGPGAPRTIKEVLDRVSQTRARGYAIVIDSYEAGTSAVAVAIHSPHGGLPVGTLSIAGPSVRMTPEKMDTFVETMQECAGQLAVLSLKLLSS